MDIKEIQEELLLAIGEDGPVAGKAYYNLHEKDYERLDFSEAASFWRDIISALEKKMGMLIPMAIIMKDDEDLYKDPFAMDSKERDAMIYRRQTFYKEDGHINSLVIKDYFNVCERLVELNKKHGSNE